MSYEHLKARLKTLREALERIAEESTCLDTRDLAREYLIEDSQAAAERNGAQP